MGERLSLEEVHSDAGRGHKLRYILASAFCIPGYTVLDAACGIGYGKDILTQFGANYIGVDKNPSSKDFIKADLCKWQPDFDFDIGVSFETIEHLPNYDNLLHVLKQAKRWIICSVPTVPTTHMNPWHLHDFQPQELPSLIEDSSWEYYQYLGQPSELSEIYIFKRRFS